MNPIASLGTPTRATRSEVPRDLVPGETINPIQPGRAQHDLAGYGRLLSAMKFMRWAIEQERFPTAHSVVDHFGVSIATAYRWTAALAEAYGIDPAIRHGDKRHGSAPACRNDESSAGTDGAQFRGSRHD